MKYSYLPEAKFHLAMAKGLKRSTEKELRFRCIDNARKCIQKERELIEFNGRRFIDRDYIENMDETIVMNMEKKWK